MYQVLDGRLTEVTKMRGLSLGWPKGGYVWPLNRGLSSHSFLQLFWDFQFWPLNREWLPNGGFNCIKIILT